jgi:hypothetical protein
MLDVHEEWAPQRHASEVKCIPVELLEEQSCQKIVAAL